MKQAQGEKVCECETNINFSEISNMETQSMFLLKKKLKYLNLVKNLSHIFLWCRFIFNLAETDLEKFIV